MSDQIALRPLDLILTAYLALSKTEFTILGASRELGVVPSQIHAALKRAQAARLITSRASGSIAAQRGALEEFVLHGVRYAFPVRTGGPAQGVPTAFAGPSLRRVVAQENQILPVWPHPDGQVRGYALYPLHPLAPGLVTSNPALHDLLTLIDALRIGAARERKLATEAISRALE